MAELALNLNGARSIFFSSRGNEQNRDFPLCRLRLVERRVRKMCGGALPFSRHLSRLGVLHERNKPDDHPAFSDEFLHHNQHYYW